MALTPFQAYQGRTDFIEVKMNSLDILLPGTEKTAIGTRDLNGCTAVVILGNATLIAHIAPRADRQTPGDVHLKQQLSGITSLYTNNRAYFPKSTTTWAFFGTIGGSPMQEVVATVKAHLSNDGLLVQPRFYNVAPASTRSLSAGEVVAAVRARGGLLELYCEKDLIERKRISTVQSTAGPSTEVVRGQIAQTHLGDQQSRGQRGPERKGEEEEEDDSEDDDDDDDDEDDNNGQGLTRATSALQAPTTAVRATKASGSQSTFERLAIGQSVTINGQQYCRTAQGTFLLGSSGWVPVTESGRSSMTQMRPAATVAGSQSGIERIAIGQQADVDGRRYYRTAQGVFLLGTSGWVPVSGAGNKDNPDESGSSGSEDEGSDSDNNNE